MAKSKHKDVEFAVDDGGNERIFNTYDEAVVFAVGKSIAHGDKAVFVDVLIFSDAGARWWGGDDGVEQYREDPDASVFERVSIRAEALGRIY